MDNIIRYNLRRAEQEAIRAIANEGRASDAHAELSRLHSNRALWALSIRHGCAWRIGAFVPKSSDRSTI